MPGLSMKIGAYGAGGSSTGAQNSVSAPSTASEAAWGSGYSGSKAGGGLLAALTPNDAFGIAHWAGLAATGFLVWLYWTLPN